MLGDRAGHQSDQQNVQRVGRVVPTGHSTNRFRGWDHGETRDTLVQAPGSSVIKRSHVLTQCS